MAVGIERAAIIGRAQPQCVGIGGAFGDRDERAWMLIIGIELRRAGRGYPHHIDAVLGCGRLILDQNEIAGRERHAIERIAIVEGGRNRDIGRGGRPGAGAFAKIGGKPVDILFGRGMKDRVGSALR